MSPDDFQAEAAALQAIVEGTASETGAAFFDALVKNLAMALGTRCAWVTEWIPEGRRLRALSFWARDHYVLGYEYPIEGTPCAAVIEERQLIHVPEQLLELFPDDPDLAPLDAHSYMGVPLVDEDGRMLGHLAVMDDAPMPANTRATAIFRIFAGRASAELRRMRRERALKERERKLALLIGNAMDAILELDGDLRVVGTNPAARQIFEVSDSASPAELRQLLTAESRGKLAYLAAELGRLPQGQQSLWIPDGLEAIAQESKRRFPAEATLSRFEIESHPHFVLILRNVGDRQAAEDRIRELLAETEYLQEELRDAQGAGGIVGRSPALRRVLEDLERVAATDATVLVTGETGTGKELVARAIHERSPRAGRPFVRVNCAAIPGNLVESEFFGHEKGAFTGALQRREGRFRLADQGTLFLDEVGELPMDLQAKLLRVLQEGEFEPVGSSTTQRVNVRVIAATNRDLRAMVRAGTFREDLYYRLHVFPLELPPLRDRGDDVVLLAEAFAAKYARHRGVALAPLSSRDRDRLLRYDWPGNVRELENVIERAFITSLDGRRLNLERALPESELGRAQSPPTDSGAPASPERIWTAAELAEFERDNLRRALAQTGGKISGAGGAAELLGLHPNTLSSRMKALRIPRRL